MNFLQVVVRASLEPVDQLWKNVSAAVWFKYFV